MKIKLIVSDIDGTAVQYPNKPFYSSWDALQGVLSAEEKKEWVRLRDSYVGKRDSYREGFNAQLLLLKGKKVSDAEKVLFPIPYSPGFLDFFKGDKNFHKAILSAGVDLVVKKIAEEADFEYYVCQSLGVKDGFFTGEGTSFKNLNKKERLVSLINHFKIPLSETCYIGDDFPEVDCFKVVGLPIAFKPKNGLENYVKENKIPVIKNFRELNEILR